MRRDIHVLYYWISRSTKQRDPEIPMKITRTTRIKVFQTIKISGEEL